MRNIFYAIGKFFIGLSGKRINMEKDLFLLSNSILDCTEGDRVNKNQTDSLRKKAYRVLINYGFDKKY